MLIVWQNPGSICRGRHLQQDGLFSLVFRLRQSLVFLLLQMKATIA